MKALYKIKKYIDGYKIRLLLNLLLNACTAFFSIFSFIMLIPFLQLIFKAEEVVHVKYPFWVGAVVLLLSVLWTFFTTKEEAPQNLNGEKQEGGGFLHALADIGRAFKEMPRTMRQLWWVKFFTWYGLPLMWQYLGLSIARHVYQASNQSDAGFAEGMKKWQVQAKTLAPALVWSRRFMDPEPACWLIFPLEGQAVEILAG